MVVPCTADKIVAFVTLQTPDQITIFDNRHNKPFLSLKYSSEVLEVKYRQDYLVVCLLEKIIIYKFSDIKNKQYKFKTIPNPYGAVCVATGENKIIAFPGEEDRGDIVSYNIDKDSTNCIFTGFVNNGYQIT